MAEKLLTKTDDSYILDFNKLIPMPEDLKIESGSRGEKGLIFLYLSSNDPNERLILEKAYRSLNPFNKQIYKDVHFKEMDSNLAKYKIDDSFKEDIELGNKYLNNYKKYGYCNWYNWSVDKWGTKWNVEDEVSVIDLDDDNYEIRFDTAWSCPVGIIKEFSKLCDNGELDWMYYDEDYDGHTFITKEDNELVITKEYIDEDYDEDIKI